MKQEKNTEGGENKSTLNLYQKLVEIRKEIQYAQKTARGYNFQYATESQILGMIRPKMDELGVLLQADIGNPTFFTIKENVKGQMVELNKFWIPLTFSWINADNPQERLSSSIPGMGSCTKDCQEIGSVITYNHRYFLYKSLSVPTDKDDPDTFDNMVNKNKDREDTQAVHTLSDEQIATIKSMADEGRIKKICNMYSSKSLNEVESKHFQFIMEGLNRKQAVGA